jgi:hypothetical protein
VDSKSLRWRWTPDQVDASDCLIALRSDILKYERGVSTAKAEAVRHDCLETGFLLVLDHQRHTFDCQVRIVDVERRRDEVVFEHQQPMDNPGMITYKRLISGDSAGRKT